MYLQSKFHLHMKEIILPLGGSTNRISLNHPTIHKSDEMVYIPHQSHRWILRCFRESELIYLNEKWHSCISWQDWQSSRRSIRHRRGECQKNTNIVWFELYDDLSFITLEAVLCATENQRNAFEGNRVSQTYQYCHLKYVWWYYHKIVSHWCST